MKRARVVLSAALVLAACADPSVEGEDVIVAGVLTAVLGRSMARAGVLFGASAGLLWAASDATIRPPSLACQTSIGNLDLISRRKS